MPQTDQLPANPVADFAKKAAANRRSEAHAPINGSILKFSGKTGDWSLGIEDIDVEGETFLLMVDSLQHGFMRWGEDKPYKTYTSIAQPIPEKPADYEGVDDDGNPMTYHPVKARCFFGKFMDDDLGQFTFESGSMGGVERVDDLIDKIMVTAMETEYCYPKVKLSNDFYKRSTGKVFKPVFEIVAWCNVEGEVQTLKVEQEAAEPKEAPRKRRRKRA